MRPTDRIPLLDLADVTPLPGGISGAPVWRARFEQDTVVVKRTTRSELLALRLLTDLNDPALPRLLDSGIDATGPWVMTPFHPGATAGLTAGLPDSVHRCMGRVHARFAGKVDGYRDDLEVIDAEFVDRVLTEFAPDRLLVARPVLGDRLCRRVRKLLDRLAADQRFGSAAERFPSTLLHGDLYGMNVLLPQADGDPEPLIIDWNCARVGPAMFDVAMSAPYDSAARRAHDAGWAEICPALPAEQQSRAAHAWSSALINAAFAAVVAVRSSVQDAVAMITDGEQAAERFAGLVG